MRRSVLAVGVVAVLFGLVTLVTGSAKALDEQELLEYSLNDIMFYEQCGNDGVTAECGIQVSGSTIEEKIWTGLTSFMSEEQAAGVMGNMAHEGGFNPARHETKFLNSSPNFAITTDASTSYGIGLIQWSFGRRVKLLDYIKEKADELLDKYFDTGRSTYGGISGKEFLSQVGDSDTNTLVALELCYLKQEIENNATYSGILNTSTVKEASDYFLEHIEVPADIEGQRATRYEDAQKYFDEFQGKTFSDSDGSDSAVDDSDPCNSNMYGSKNINGAAVALAWPLDTDKDVWGYTQANGKVGHSAYYDTSKWTGGSATDLFNEALDKVYGKGSDDNHKKWGQCPSIGASCDVGVGTTVRYSGYDPKFPRGLDGQISHAKANPDLWELLNGNGLEPKPGDVVHTSGHTYIVVQDEKGDFYRVESALCRSFWHVTRKFKGFESGSQVLRAKNAKNSTTGVSVKDGVKTSSLTGTLTAGTGQGNGDIGAAARYFAWPEGTSSTDIKTHAYRPEEWEKLREDNGKPKINLSNGLSSTQHIAMGRSCVIFVWGVLRYAGLVDNFGFSEHLDEELMKEPDWEKVGSNLKISEMQDGDVLVAGWKNGNGNPGHYGIFVRDADGTGRTIEASLHAPAYGRVLKKRSENSTIGNYDVWRNKKNKSGGVNCDLCGGEGDGFGDMQLKAGGMTLSEAKEFMKAYHDAAMGKYYKKKYNITFLSATISNANCPYGVMNNCVAFSQWFVNKYTTIGPNWTSTTNGVGMVNKLTSTKGLKKGDSSSPRPYAIFSNAQWSSAGHTGVVLGVDEKAKKIVVGEASCSWGAGHLYYEPRAVEYSFDYIKKNGWSFAYTDEVLSKGGQLKDV